MGTHKSIVLVTLAWLGLLLVATLMLAACGGQDTQEATPTEASQQTPEPTITAAPIVAPGETLEATPTLPVQETPGATASATPTAAPLEATSAVAQGLASGPGKIAFASTRGGGSEIYVINADGSNLARLTHSLSSSEPSWSPEGSRIVFSSAQDGNDEIYVMDADGSNQTRLTNTPHHEIMPAWSPDGSRIAYVTRVGEGNFEIYVMDADGSNQTRLTFDLESDNSPTWSPDGTRIAFLSTRQGHREIFLMNADGSNQAPLMDLEPTGIFNRHQMPAWSPDGAWPAWSSDGKRIVFLFDRDNPEMYVMNADGTNVTRLEAGPNLFWGSSWAPGSVPEALAAAPTPTSDMGARTHVEPATSAGVLELIGTALVELAESPTAGVHVHGNYAYCRVSAQLDTIEA